MNFESQYNVKSPAVKRLMREALEMREPTEDYSAAPTGDNLFEWHFTIRGASETDFEGGVYHGRIIFPSEYPMKPPNIVLLTPNGRFEINKKICLSISGHHPETWQPSWCVRTALLALIAFMPTSGSGTVGSLDYPPEERRLLAKKSKDWKCSECGKISDLLLNTDSTDCSKPPDDEKAVLQSDHVTTPVSVPEESSSSDTIANEPPTEAPNSYPLQSISQLNATCQYENRDIMPDSSSQSKAASQYENRVVDNETPLLNTNLFSSTLSNLSNSKITISVIVILIALLLYRRIYLIDYN